MIPKDLQHLFKSFNIGKGLAEYERGKAILQKDEMLTDDRLYGRAIKALVKWCRI